MMYKHEFENESVKQSNIFKPATDTFMAAVPWTKNRMVVVFRRERNGREYVRCRTFNRHQVKKIWYPSPRFYMVPVDCAEELGKAIIAAARARRTASRRVGGSISTSSTRRGNGGASSTYVRKLPRPAMGGVVRCLNSRKGLGLNRASPFGRQRACG